MKTKKHPKANLENYSKLFAQLGLVLSLTIVYVLIQNKSFAKDIAILDDSGKYDIETVDTNIDYKIEEPKVVEVKKKVNLDDLDIKENDTEIKETFIDPPVIDDPVDPNDLHEYKEPEEIIEDVFPIILVSKAPRFPGCKGTEKELKECFTSKVRKFVGRKFDSDIATEMGLSPGTQRIFVVFKIDETGKVIDVLAKSPHKRLENEAIRVVNLLPQMTPGKQQERTVKVSFSLPITFKVE